MSMMTGETYPVRARVGDDVIGGTILIDAPLTIATTQSLPPNGSLQRHPVG